jgi:hypothetical protein
MANEQTSVPLYAASEILTAANMNISAGTGVPVFATTVTRDAAFGGASEKVLAEGQLCYLSASNIVQFYDGAAWATVGPAGKVLQVVQNTFSTSTTTTSTSFVTSGLNATITPSLATSKVLIFTSQAYEMTTAGENAYQTLFRGTVAGTNLATSNFGLGSSNATYVVSQQSMTFLDSPNTTSAQIYTSGMKVSGGTLKAQIANSTGVMILMEIGA